ncbi:hypothetical protein [Catenulispora rubra]|nr:hypothetical protein [Catenulispora rubra]
MRKVDNLLALGHSKHKFDKVMKAQQRYRIDGRGWQHWRRRSGEVNH